MTNDSKSERPTAAAPVTAAAVGFIPSLHGLRAIAALGVVFFHWVSIFPTFNIWLAQFQIPGHPWLNPTLPWALGWQGVPLFFVLSGYLLTSQWLTRGLSLQSLVHFYKRRALRIYPAVWVQLLVLVGLAGLLPTIWTPVTWHSLIPNVVMWINLPPVFTSPINDVWWTLPVELMFYLILPLLVWLRRRVGLMLVMTLLASITVGWRWWVTHQHSGENMAAHLAILDSLPGTLFTFGAGFAIAHMQVHLKPTHATRILWMSVAGFFAVQTVLVSNIEVYWQGGWLLRIWSSTLAMSLAGFVLAICLGAGGFLAKLCSSNTMVWLGELSFGIYLWHFPVMQLLNALYPQLAPSAGGSLLALAITIALTLGLAALSYYKLERPLMEARMETS